MKALILENSRVFRQLTDKILGQHGCINDLCSSIGEAKLLIDSASYDIICISHHLEDGNGLDFVKYCKLNKLNQNSSILYFTSEKKLKEKIEPLGIDLLIFKQNLAHIADQITRFIESRHDTIFSEGRIMVVEDSKTDAAIMLPNIRDQGYEVVHFENAESAWAEYENEKAFGSDTNAYDMVITDINLPGKMSGVGLVSNLRGLEDARGFVPIIGITSEYSDKLRLSLYKSGINDFVQKPVLIPELLIRINNLITNKRLLDKVHDQRRDLFKLATTDKLTGCHSRHSLMDTSSKLLDQATRHQFPVSLLVIDLDYFKSVNDTYGHAIGDIVLQEIGNLLNNFFRDSDFVARFGGEEFVVLLDHCGEQDASRKSEALRVAIEALKPNDLVITASIGVTTRSIGQTGDFDALFAIADQGVYTAKENGRNRVEISVPKED